MLHKRVQDVYQTDVKVMDLIRLLQDVFASIGDYKTLSERVDTLKHPILDLLVQTIECCNFISEYVGHNFAGKLDFCQFCQKALYDDLLFLQTVCLIRTVVRRLSSLRKHSWASRKTSRPERLFTQP